MLLYALAWVLCTLLMRDVRAAVAHWAAFMMAMSAAFVLIGLRGEPRLWHAYSGANILMIAGYVVARRGFERFLHHPPRDREHALTLGVAVLAFGALGPSADNAYWRVLLAYGGSAAILLRANATLLPDLCKEYGRRASFVIAFPTFLVIALGLLRVGQQVLDPDRQLELHLTQLNNTPIIMAYLVGAATFNFSYMTMVMVRLTRRLRSMSLQDALTGLPNRRVFETRLAQEWSRWRRHHTPVTVLAIDLDHFKHINDTRGHLAGDEVLVQVGQRLQGAVRQIDTVARTGGEEFLVLLPDTDVATAHSVAERLRAAIHALPCLLQGDRIPVTASIGCAQAARQDADTQALLSRADAALYRAKEAGRDRVCTDRADLLAADAAPDAGVARADPMAVR